MTALTYLNLQGLTMYGNTEGIGALTNIQQLRLLSIANLECHLSDFAQCSTLNSLICSDNSKIYGTLEDLLPLAGTLSSLHLNGAINVCGNLKSLKNLSNLTESSFGSTGVSGKITDLNGMKTSGTLSLRVSAHIENDINSVALVNNNTYTITFSGGVVTGIN